MGSIRALLWIVGFLLLFVSPTTSRPSCKDALVKDISAGISSAVCREAFLHAIRRDEAEPEAPSNSGNHSSSAETSLGHLQLLPNGTLITVTDPKKLPIIPVISPAVGVAGALLLVTGLLYCTIGIKSKSYHLFFSTLYSIGICVIVLVLYLINPPASNGIQGAYLGIALAAGVVGGVFSLIFREHTQIVVYQLGGFCFAMWVLCLTDGGTVKSAPGKVAFICIVTVLPLGFTLSRHTRYHGLIACLAFSGATAAMVGIDCFTRAGLKEFWIYIWGVNKKEFPIGTHTYPATPGILAENCCIIPLALVGAALQMQNWESIRQRRADEEAVRQQSEAERRAVEAEIGQRTQQDMVEREEWEQTFGGNLPTPPTQRSSKVMETSASSSQRGPNHRTSDEEVPLADLGSTDRDERPSTAPTSVPSMPLRTYPALTHHPYVEQTLSEEIHHFACRRADQFDSTGMELSGPMPSSAAATLGDCITPMESDKTLEHTLPRVPSRYRSRKFASRQALEALEGRSQPPPAGMFPRTGTSTVRVPRQNSGKLPQLTGLAGCGGALGADSERKSTVDVAKAEMTSPVDGEGRGPTPPALSPAADCASQAESQVDEEHPRPGPPSIPSPPLKYHEKRVRVDEWAKRLVEAELPDPEPIRYEDPVDGFWPAKPAPEAQPVPPAELARLAETMEQPARHSEVFRRHSQVPKTVDEYGLHRRSAATQISDSRRASRHESVQSSTRRRSARLSWPDPSETLMARQREMFLQRQSGTGSDLTGNGPQNTMVSSRLTSATLQDDEPLAAIYDRGQVGEQTPDCWRTQPPPFGAVAE
ncbi:hypothetical protein EJ06DRAFT_200081 [Trichodelitschia bisporula]|uniref:TM7S3/TM198-like domain-containing protein n=1 Tax=Trichodelitschia bisporula TaxID=703511 RepID=A0A6G1I851_9PEZI|nr:hypothetical protein EJ06DRAFT_200081 [Trichodelitschia bisporula]